MSAWWIVGSYFLLGLGDILLETSGMSATTKLAPRAFASQTMSLWFLSLALANGIQAQTVKLYDDVSKPAYFGVNGAIAVAAGLARDRRSRPGCAARCTPSTEGPHRPWRSPPCASVRPSPTRRLTRTSAFPSRTAPGCTPASGAR